jgi:ketosteroid isomerase-like protein
MRRFGAVAVSEPWTAAQREILAAERALYDAMSAKDFAAQERILHPDLSYVHSTAVVETRTAYLAGVAAGLYDYGAIASRDVRIRIDGDTAVSYGIVDMHVAAEGEPKELLHLIYVLAWARHEGRWRLLLRQATRMPQ